MAIALYMDVHIPQAITNQLRRRGIDVLPLRANCPGFRAR